jgi:PAS domain S-box-containing protein
VHALRGSCPSCLSAPAGLWLALCLLFGAAAPVRADADVAPVVVGPGFTELTFAGRMGLLEDPDGLLGAEDVLSRPVGALEAVPGQAPSLGLSDAYFWLRFDLARLPGAPAAGLVLDLGSPVFTVAELYLSAGPPGAHPPFARLEAGRESATPGYFRLPPLPEGRVTAALRVRCPDSDLYVLPRLFSESAYAAFDRRQSLFEGAFLGLAVALLLYNLILLVILRDQAYLWYVLHLAVIAAYNLVTLGAARHLPSTWQGGAYLFYNVSLVPIGLTIARFVQTFLGTREAAPRLHRALWAYAAFSLGMGFMAFLPPQTWTIPGVAWALATSVLAITAGVLRAVQGFAPAVAFLAAWVLYLAGGISHSLTFIGVLPQGFWTYRAIALGSACEFVLMSLALAWRIRLLRADKRAAEAERERLAAESALQRLVIDHSGLGLALVDGGRVALANRRLAELLGREPGELAGAQAEDLVRDAAGRPVFAFPDNPGGPVHEAEAAIRRPQGGLLHARVLARAVDPAEPARGAVWLLEDVSDRKRLEELREDVERIMRHDLKGPLNAVIGFADILAAEPGLDANQRRWAGAIRDAGFRMLDQINRSLDLYKMERGTYRLAPEPVDLVHLVRLLAGELLVAALARRVVVTALCRGEALAPDSFLPALGEEMLVRLTLSNLLVNALEAAPPGGDVTVSLSAEEGYAVVRIENDGPVPREIRARFFEKYVTHGKPHGTGLGTYAARLMTRTMGGEVDMRVEEERRTVVTVRLPLGE